MKPTRVFLSTLAVSSIVLMLALGSSPSCAAGAASKRVKNEPVVVSVLTPPGFVRGQKAPVLIALPPGGQTPELANRMLDRYWRAEGAKRGWVIVSLAARGDALMFEEPVAKLVQPLVDRTLVTAGVVPSRFAIGGISNGGLSAFAVALRSPSTYRALVVMPGFPFGANVAKVPTLKNMRVAMWVGANDDGWVQPMRKTRDTLAKLGANVSLVEVPNAGHRIEGIEPAAIFDALES